MRFGVLVDRKPSHHYRILHSFEIVVTVADQCKPSPALASLFKSFCGLIL